MPSADTWAAWIEVLEEERIDAAFCRAERDHEEATDVD